MIKTNTPKCLKEKMTEDIEKDVHIIQKSKVTGKSIVSRIRQY